ncbi:MAG: ROK family protein [Clostridia bacterium]|nr:ROK family protein [Clostridia bacterium]MBQ7375753.1 ROK family protein [Clostridia bacterium]
MYRIGIDLGGTNIAVGIVNDEHKIVVKKTTPTLAKRPPEEIVADMARVCLEACAELNVNIKDIANIGIASPGIANPVNGCVEYANNLPFLRFPIVQLLADGLGIDRSVIKIANDANAAAWGEAVAGAAKGSANSIMVTLGTGVGGGIIINNKILVGFNSAAGEIGHIVIEQDGAPCGCGRRGCWEAYSSATALIRMTKEAVEECKKTGRYTSMLKAERISGRTACDAMRAGDEVGTEVYNKYVKYLATGITNLVNIFQPEVISLGGGVSNEGQSLIDAITPLVRAEQYGGDVVALTQLRIATLGNDAGIIGAAALE